MFANACKAEGVQPIIGTLLGVARDREEGKQVDYLPLYAQDEAGYDNLCHLVSKAHLERPLEYGSACPDRTTSMAAPTG